ncbi:MAG: sigma-70 family RNA polymerase sigma factor [Ruminococcus sp.]|nr:sigma-70 family RNA polymerase sigma factor [Ruminococcus sp.]
MIPVIYMSLVEDEEIPAFEKLYIENKNKAYMTAFGILKNESLSEECVSETFLAVANNFQKVHNLKPYEQQKYIVISIRSRAFNILKKEKEHKADVPYDDELYFGGDSYSDIDLSAWKENIRRLNKTDKDILYLVTVQGMGYREAGAALGISYAAAKQRFWAAKNNLRRLLAEGDGNA